MGEARPPTSFEIAERLSRGSGADADQEPHRPPRQQPLARRLLPRPRQPAPVGDAQVRQRAQRGAVGRESKRLHADCLRNKGQSKSEVGELRLLSNRHTILIPADHEFRTIG